MENDILVIGDCNYPYDVLGWFKTKTSNHIRYYNEIDESKRYNGDDIECIVTECSNNGHLDILCIDNCKLDIDNKDYAKSKNIGEKLSFIAKKYNIGIMILPKNKTSSVGRKFIEKYQIHLTKNRFGKLN